MMFDLSLSESADPRSMHPIDGFFIRRSNQLLRLHPRGLLSEMTV